MNVLLFLVRFFSTLVSLVAVFKCAYISPYTVAVAFCSKCTWTEACVCCVSWCHAGVVASPVHPACRGRRGTAGLPYNCPPSQTWWAPAETPLNWPWPSDPNLRSTSSSNHRSHLIIQSSGLSACCVRYRAHFDQCFETLIFIWRPLFSKTIFKRSSWNL